jgi:hypothetical protein
MASPVESLRRIAAAHGEAAPPLPAVDDRDLAAAAGLVALDAAWLAPALAAPPALAGLGTALATFAGQADAAAATFAGADEALGAAVRAAAAARPGRRRVLLVGGASSATPAADGVTRADLGDVRGARAAVAAAADTLAVLVVEPWLADAGDADALRALLAAARAAGAAVVVDETRTALRAAPTTVAAALGLAADAVVMGSALAAGLPFAAVVGPLAAATGSPMGASAVARAVAGAVLAADRAPLQRDLAAASTALRAGIATAAAREALDLAWRGPATMPELRFVGQEDADGALIGTHFAGELAALGVRIAGPLLLPAGALADVAPLRTAFDRGLLRIRVLLVEYNSHLSGELPFAFPGGDPTLRARGAGVYRYPRRGKVRVAVAPAGTGIRIDFAPAALGPVTSSGFFVPTALRGDVDVTARYVLRRWESGPDSACLGLFLQNAASTARYYAQVMSTADAPQARFVAAGLAGVVSPRRSAPADEGWLRIQRQGGAVRAFHRTTPDGPWTLLGEHVGATTDDLIVGAKIWSKDRTDGLVADVFDLAITGAVSPAQEPLLGPRPDPNDAPAH